MKVQQRIGLIIRRTLGYISFVRLLEWREMLKLLRPRSDEKILDIACGAGESSLQIARRNCELHGIDMSSTSILKALQVKSDFPKWHLLISDA
ncbi:class I SAM-dependent methyltransferase, partial [Chloroflexota bacterium]